MKPFIVTVDSEKYPVYVERNALSTLGERLKAVSGRALVVTDRNVWPLYGEAVQSSLEQAGVAFDVEVLPPGEPTKSADMLLRLYARLAELGHTRSDAVLTLGGGVIGDLAGMAAATWLRGVPFVQVPTTLLAQVDSSIGGKVAIDLPQGKNLVGAFHQPRFVLIDPAFVKSLPEREFACGMGEVIKHAAIADATLFELLERKPGRAAVTGNLAAILQRNLSVKRAAVRHDERDHGARMTLNFGHTIGHALERQAGYEGISHGEAIAIGMCHITARSEAMGLTKLGTAARLRALCQAFGLPTALEQDKREGLLQAMALDKKTRGNTITLALLQDIGAVRLETVALDQLELFL